jgi:glycosyltransferase involved in cell wall biosynthesis
MLAEATRSALQIGIDYTAAVRQRAGIGRYTRCLVRALAAQDSTFRYTLFVAGGWGEGDGLGPWPANFRIRTVPVSDRWMHALWQRLRLPIPVQLFTGRLDLFHSPDFVLPPIGRMPGLLTVHDLSFMRVPECFVPGFSNYLVGAVSHAVRRAAWIVADSKSTRKDLVDLLGVEAGRVSVLYPGVEPRFRPVTDPVALASVRQRYELPGRYILGLGTLQPRKNLDGLIEGFTRLLAAEGTRGELEDLHLVLAGEKGWMYESIFDAVRKAGVERLVRFTGYIAEEDLPALYSLASVFASPSWYEGFGLPVLEAMACGVPVVAADNSSFPEVVGEAGLLVSAADRDAIAYALARAVTDAALRSRLLLAGEEQARKFTWDKSAAELQALYGALGRGCTAGQQERENGNAPHGAFA